MTVAVVIGRRWKVMAAEAVGGPELLREASGRGGAQTLVSRPHGFRSAVKIPAY